MKFSALMSVYRNDNPEHLRLALRSIYENQTKKPDEIIVIFDGPLTNELYQVLEEFAMDKCDVVRYYPQENNCGLGASLKIGTKYCSGDYIVRMDADDISHPMRFEKQISYIESHPEIDVLGTDIAEFDQSIDEKKLRIRSCPQKHDRIVHMGKTRNPMNHVSVCIKKSALEKCGGYEELPLLEDYYLWLKMIVAGCKLENINESLVYVRVGNGFVSKRGSRKRVHGWWILQNYMLDNKLIGLFKAMSNMLCIFGFVYCPTFVRKMAYDLLLRK